MLIRRTFDTETYRFRDGVKAPELVCVSLKEDGGPSQLYHWSESESVLRRIWGPDSLVVGQYVAYDACVTVANFPDLTPMVWAAYSEGRVTDTKIREQLLDIQKGHFDGYFDEHEKYRVPQYSLAHLMWKYARINRFGSKGKKGPEETEEDEDEGAKDAIKEGEAEGDVWRLRYHELHHLPLKLWPPEAVAYPLQDVDDTDLVYLAQEGEGAGSIAHQWAKARVDFALTLASNWGLRTDAATVDRIRLVTEQRIQELRDRLKRYGFVRSDKRQSKDTKRVQQFIMDLEVDRVRSEGTPWHESAPRFKTTPKKTQVFNEERAKAGLPPAQWWELPIECISLSSGSLKDLVDDCLVEGPDGQVDNPLQDYSDLGETLPVLTKDLKALQGGTLLPIHTSWSMAITDRIRSKKPNVQNWRVYPGIREAFVPREGYVFLQADYGGLELSTLGEVCRQVVGFSRLADLIREGLDPHLMVAATFAGCTYEEAYARHKQKDPHIKELRDMSKAYNFGLPGGLGDAKFRLWAKASYGVDIPMEKVAHYRSLWLGTLPEMPQYFAYIRSLRVTKTKRGGDFAFSEVHTGRRRSGVRYTEACNGHFQSLGAAATQAAFFAVSLECYNVPTSPLYGCRPVNYIHDEFILEAPRAQAADAAQRLEFVMNQAVIPYMPYAPPKAPPVLMERWSKLAHEVFDASGKLIPWDLNVCDCKSCSQGRKDLDAQGLLV